MFKILLLYNINNIYSIHVKYQNDIKKSKNYHWNMKLYAKNSFPFKKLSAIQMFSEDMTNL